MASAEPFTIQISNLDQANAIRDVIEHRVLIATSRRSEMVELEENELWELVVFLHRLTSLIGKEEGS